MELNFLKKIMDFIKNYAQEQERVTREELEIAKENFVNGFDGGEKFHCSNDQYYRFRRALSNDKIGKVIRVNRRKRTMDIHSSYNPNKTYHVSFNKCGCMDFQERGLPCKHMYRLALELGIITSDWNLTGLSDELKNTLDSLTKTAIQRLLKLMDENGKSRCFNGKLRGIPSKLFECGFVIDMASISYSLDKFYKKDELLAMLQSGSAHCDMGMRNKKNEIVNYIVDNEPKLAKTLYKDHAFLSFSDVLIDNYDYIHRYCEHLLGLLEPWLDYA